jgi:hypothetical protein
VGLKLNGTDQLLAHADDVNLMGDNIVTIKKSTETLTEDSKEVGIEVNVEKTKYMFFTRMFGILLRIYYDVKGTVNASGVSTNKQLIANYQSIYLKIQQTFYILYSDNT